MIQGYHERLFLVTSHEITYWKAKTIDKSHAAAAMNLEAVCLQATGELRDSSGRVSESPNRASFSQASSALHKDGYVQKGCVLFESIRACDKSDRDLELETMERTYQLRALNPAAASAFQAGLQEAAVERRVRGKTGVCGFFIGCAARDALRSQQGS